MPVVLLLAGLAVAVPVARLFARKAATPRVAAAGTFVDMLFVGLLAGRLAFVVQWWPQYAADPWAVIRPGDGGYVLWVAIPAGLAFGAWRAHRRPELRRPLAWGAGAGLATWAVLAVALSLMQRTAVQLPDAELTRLEGGAVRLPEFTGRPMVVNLWATWCPPCRREMPVLAEAQAQRADVAFVFVNQGEGANEVRDYLRGGAMALRNVVLDPASRVSQSTGARGLPTTLFFDAGGRLVDVHMGELTRAGLAQKLRRFGATQPAPSSSSR
jgi:thiol-disulfide isomerase/thioredoxin